MCFFCCWVLRVSMIRFVMNPTLFVDSGLWLQSKPPALPTLNHRGHKSPSILLTLVVDRAARWNLDISQRGKTKEDAVKCFDDFSLFRHDGFPRVTATAIKIRHRLPALRASNPPGGTGNLGAITRSSRFGADSGVRWRWSGTVRVTSTSTSDRWVKPYGRHRLFRGQAPR